MSKKADLRGNLRQSRSSAHGFRKLSTLNGFNLRRERRQPELTFLHPPSALPGPAVVPAMSAECPCRDASIGRDTTRLAPAFQLLFSYAECPKLKICHAPWPLSTGWHHALSTTTRSRPARSFTTASPISGGKRPCAPKIA